MKKIINQKRYDTDKAKKVGCWENQYARNDFNWCQETLYRKKTGEFFLHGEGNASSKYAESCGNNSWTGGEKLIPLSYDKARQWAEEKLSVDEYEAIFGEVEDDDSRVMIAFTVPASTAEKLNRLASQLGSTKSELITDLIERLAIDTINADQSTPPEFPGAESFQNEHEKYLAWERSEEGQKFMKKNLPPEAYEEYLKDLEQDRAEGKL